MRKLKNVLPDGGINKIADELSLHRHTVAKVLGGREDIASDATTARIRAAAIKLIRENIKKEKEALAALAS